MNEQAIIEKVNKIISEIRKEYTEYKDRISRDGKMIETNKFYRVPTREDFYKWCTDRNVNFDLEKCNK